MYTSELFFVFFCRFCNVFYYSEQQLDLDYAALADLHSKIFGRAPSPPDLSFKLLDFIGDIN